MKFYDGKEKETIKEYTKENEWYEIIYLDNESDYYPNEDPNHELEIQQRIIEQVLNREKEFLEKYKKEEMISTLLFLISLPSAYITYIKGPLILLIASSIIATLSGIKLIKVKRRLKDIKKYRMYLDMKDELIKPENRNIYNIIECDKQFQVALNLSTIDKYSYGSVKALKLEIDKRTKQKDNIK